MADKPVIIALCGKGGVGKTSMSALITRMFAQDPSKRVLAIDADPAVGLSYPLGVPVTKTVDQIRRELIGKLGKDEPVHKEDLLRQLDYDMFSALSEKGNLAFLAIGRPEGDGCYCQVNQLLRELIRDIASQFDVVIIDGEAGIEQISRRVMDMVTHLLIVTDGSLKGRNVAETIYHLGKEACVYEKSGVLFNRVKHDGEEFLVLEKNTLPLVHVMRENETIRDFDREGLSFFDLPATEDLKHLEYALQDFIRHP
jgi:CO dehydrogenase maturation factor